MKLQVIVNKAGDVLGTARFVAVEGGPTRGGVVADAGQVVHEIDVPEELTKLPADELHSKVKALLPKLPV